MLNKYNNNIIKEIRVNLLIELSYKTKDYENRIKNPEIYIKLWKERPSSPYYKPDIVEKIKFIQDL